jgi:hypothetical protein
MKYTESIEEITPEFARLLNPSPYVCRSKVKQYLKLMEEGKFLPELSDHPVNIQMTKNYKTPKLLNGNHRITAVIQLGRPVKLLVRRYSKTIT